MRSDAALVTRMADKPVRRSLLLAIAIALLFATTPAGAAESDSPLTPGGTFLDDDWNFAEGAIEAVVEQGVVEGCAPQLYCPDRALTRAEAAALVHRIVKPGPDSGSEFPDVDPGAWYAEEVGALAATGIVTGHTDGLFRPSDPMTRAATAHLLVRAFQENLDAKYESRPFEDVPPEAGYASAVDTLARSGVTIGCSQSPDLFCPHDLVRRDQFAMFLARLLDLELKVPPTRMAPLTGEPIKGLDWDRRVVAVKIDDHHGARPQAGVDRADAVVETLVEGGLTRWMALFHQSDSSYLGPVRSLRPTDTGIALPLGGTVAASGGQPWIIDDAIAEGVNVLREKNGRPALFRITERRAPHNLFADTTGIRRLADAAGYSDLAPEAVFHRGVLPDGPPATRISLTWSDPITITWTWDGERYLRSRSGRPHNWVLTDGSTSQVVADVLVVIVAPVSERTPPPDASGSPVPVLDTVGEGPAFVFADGRGVRGRWARASVLDSFELTTPDGELLAVPPGKPWINVFPEGRPIHS